MFPINYNPGFDLGNCQAMFTWAELAYKSDDEIKAYALSIGADGCEPFWDNIVTGTRGFVVWKGDDAVIVFMGSKTIRNWIVDARFFRRDWNGLSTHAGFAFGFDAVRSPLVAILDKLKVKRIWITGHSLGGALSVVCATWLPWHYAELAGVYTFGQPRVFGAAAAALVASTRVGKVLYRVVNEEDIVARLPGVLIGYRHLGTDVFFNSFGKMQINPTLPELIFSDGYQTFAALWLQHAGQAARIKAVDAVVLNHFCSAYRPRIFPIKEAA